MISQRAKSLKPSPTLAMANRARELQTAGQDVVSLTLGEPDWATFRVANEGGIQAIHQGFTKYTAAHGVLELRQEVARQSSQQLGVDYSADEVIIGSGSKYILYTILMMLLDPGDEVILPTPYWVSYPVMVTLAGGSVRFIETSEATQFKLSADSLSNAITNKTKALILCSPSNPTGMQYSAKELESIASVLEKNPQVIVLSDDIYNRLLFSSDEFAPHILNGSPRLKNQVVVVNGVSKSYSMTGWRLGWALGPLELIKPAADFLSQTTSNASSISQKAALAALKSGGPELVDVRKNLKSRMELFFSRMSGIKYFKLHRPDGAFYLWVDVRETFGRRHRKSGQVVKTSSDLAELLLNHHLVATVPGSEFGGEGFLRLSFVASPMNLEKAVARFEDFSSSLD